MRTKALLLAAAFAAAGVAVSEAQVYSVNAVGYVNVSLAPGFNLVSNPLNAGTGNNTVGKLMANVQGGFPAQTRVYVFNEATGAFFAPAVAFAPNGPLLPATSADLVVNPGTGMFVFIPGTATLTLTFVGEVMQGSLSNPIPTGFSVRANQVPQAGAPSSFGMPGAQGDRFYRFNKATGGYFAPNANFGGTWIPALPSIDVGEAFFLFRQGAPTAWTRTFNVNNPTG
jgi:hypothetical protein